MVSHPSPQLHRTMLEDKFQQQRSAVQHSTAQHSTAQHSTAQHSTAQHSTAVPVRNQASLFGQS